MTNWAQPTSNISLRQWATTAIGTPIALHASAPLTELRSPILFIGGVHGDEPLGVRLADDLCHWLSQQPTQDVLPWVVIPCLNPDGLRAGTRGNGRGVDLNRNYPAKSWSRECNGPRYFPGTAPASEPEIQAIVELVMKTRPRLILHFHSWQPCVVLTGPAARPQAQALADASGYEIRSSIGYETPGSLSEWGFRDQGISIICIEESDQAAVASTWPRFGPGLKKICEGKTLVPYPNI